LHGGWQGDPETGAISLDAALEMPARGVCIEQLQRNSVQIFTHEKNDKRAVTADDLFKGL
jgi:hypothetical protein